MNVVFTPFKYVYYYILCMSDYDDFGCINFAYIFADQGLTPHASWHDTDMEMLLLKGQ